MVSTDRAGEEKRAGPLASKPLSRLLLWAGTVVGLLALIALATTQAPPALLLAAAAAGAALTAACVLLLRAHRRDTTSGNAIGPARALVEVSQALAGYDELEQPLGVVTAWARQLFDTRSAGIEILDRDGTRVTLHAGIGLAPGASGSHYPIDGSFTRWLQPEQRPRSVRAEAEAPTHTRRYLGRTNTALAAAQLRFRGGVLGALFVARDRALDSGEMELLAALADQAAVAIENARLLQEVRALSLTDPLTGLANRRQLERDLDREFAAARRGRPVRAIILDLDDFKGYNDRHGHLAGDHALRVFGDVLASETRAMNLAARFGGDEFVVIISEGSIDAARVFVRRVADHFAQRADADLIEPVTFSAGIGEYRPEMAAPEDLIAAADTALYELKGTRVRL